MLRKVIYLWAYPMLTASREEKSVVLFMPNRSNGDYEIQKMSLFIVYRHFCFNPEQL